jgi:hypothetical protein
VVGSAIEATVAAEHLQAAPAAAPR